MSNYNYNFNYSINPFEHERGQEYLIRQTNQPSNNNLPKINTDTFVESAREVNELLREAVLLSNSIIQTDIGRKLMEAGQNSDTAELYRLLKEIGISQDVKISYTPHSITFTTTPMVSPNQQLRTTLTMQLIWNESF